MAIRIGIIGTGWGAKVQVPAFRYAGFEITALWGRTKDKAQKFASDLSIPFGTDDYRALIARADVDLVSIVTPPHMHAEIAAAALEAGKHVLCEKPTALNAGEAERMLKAAQANPSQLALIDHELRFLPARLRMRALIKDGYVGQIYHAEGRAASGSLLNPQRAWNWWSDKTQGGGAWGALGSHFVDALSWLIDQPITSVSGLLQTHIGQRADAEGVNRRVTTDDYCSMNFRFANGAAGALNMSFVTAGAPVHRLQIVGSAGSLTYDDEKLTGCRVDSPKPESLAVAEILDNLPPAAADPWGRGTIYLARAIKTALEEGDHSALAAAATFADGLYIQRVLDAGYNAHDHGGWVKV